VWAVYQAVSDAARLTQDEIAKATGVRGQRLADVLTVLLMRGCLGRRGARDVFGIGPVPLVAANGG
jgi:hypothetical protein